MQGFAGTTGPRLGNPGVEDTWANDFEGESADSNLMIFVR